jgi:hypothetical protein
VLAAARSGSGEERAVLAPHPVERVEGFGTRACVACHDFSFPHAESLGDKGRMQRTAGEHAASPARARECSSCHMPKTERGRGAHGFASSRDDALLASALDVKVAREEGAGRAVWTLASREVGHAFPTGDLFRRLVLRVRTPRGTIEHAFERTFRATRDAAANYVRFETTDTRLVAGQPRRVELAVPGAAGACAWEVVYQRVTSVDQSPPFAVHVESETVLARGSI